MTADFSPRAGKKHYIKPRGGDHYYHRVIPKKLRCWFGGKTEWNIKLVGRTSSERIAEAQAYAHQHNRQMNPQPIQDVTMKYGMDGKLFLDNVRLDLSSDQIFGADAFTPMTFYRDGESIKTSKIAWGSDPEFLRAAERDGFFTLPRDELIQQIALNKLMKGAEEAVSDEQREIVELKRQATVRQIEDMAVQRGDTILSALPKWHKLKQPRITTQKAHKARVQAFVDLHGDLPLSAITKRHIVDFVEHVQTITHEGKPLKPTTMANYLATISGLLSYAVGADLIQFNPAQRVESPKDNRPKVAKSYAAFEKSEVRNLIQVGTEIWTKRGVRRNSRQTRKNDLIAALHMLVWTGARPEEICQLRLVDVDIDGLVLSITNDDSDDEGLTRARFTKNENSVRDIPIHSKLAPIIADHLSLIRGVSNSSLVFPSFEPALQTGRYARPISTEWTSKLREHVTSDPRKVLYSLRHAWAAESRRTGMPEYVRNALMGHGGDNPVASRYGGDSEWIEEKRAHLEKMDCVTG